MVSYLGESVLHHSSLMILLIMVAVMEQYVVVVVERACGTIADHGGCKESGCGGGCGRGCENL